MRAPAAAARDSGGLPNTPRCSVVAATGALILLVACSHTVRGDCTHVNDLKPLARPSHLSLLVPDPALGVGEDLDAGHAFIASTSATATELLLMWRGCTRLNRVHATETPTTVTVNAAVSDCPVEYGDSTEPPQVGDAWFGADLHLAQPLGHRIVVSSALVVCDTVIH
jgi:hypothetical protein